MLSNNNTQSAQSCAHELAQFTSSTVQDINKQANFLLDDLLPYIVEGKSKPITQQAIDMANNNVSYWLKRSNKYLLMAKNTQDTELNNAYMNTFDACLLLGYAWDLVYQTMLFFYPISLNTANNI